jgi:rSAM/selenodomain-associated transferase 1
MREVAVFAKAPIAGFAKTRLIPLLGAEGAAKLQAQLIARALATARAAGIGPVTLWCAPDCAHPLFTEAGVPLRAQPEGDLGARMLAAFEAGSGALVLIGSDCPCLDAQDLRDAAAALEDADVAIAPAEDGGYGLMAARAPFPELFRDVPWSTSEVAGVTLSRARETGLRLSELRTVWDLDTPADHARAVREGLVDQAFA